MLISGFTAKVPKNGDLLRVLRPKSRPYPLKSIEVDPLKFKYALKVREVLECDLFDVIGLKDTDEKILAIWLEIMHNSMAIFHELAKKYQINEKYMRHRLLELENKLLTDAVLRDKITRLEAAFN